MSTSTDEFSNKVPIKFSKIGRPTNDAVRERLRIYRAAGPLILENGVRRTTLQAVARVAYLSPGGIYHYFGSKAHLVLYGLEPEAISRECMDSARDLHAILASNHCADVTDVIGLYVEKNVNMLEFVRPALHAAVELGRLELRRRLSNGISEDVNALVYNLRVHYPGISMVEESAGAIRRILFGLAIDEAVTTAEARRQLLWLFQRIIPGARCSHRATGAIHPARAAWPTPTG